MKNITKKIVSIGCVFIMTVGVSITAMADESFSLEEYRLRGLGAIAYDADDSGQVGDNPEDAIYESQDLVVLERLVKSGKENLTEAINSYQSGNVENLDTFDNYVHAINGLTTVPDIYYYDAVTEGPNCQRYVLIDGSYYPCDQHGNVSSEKALTGIITVVAKDDTREAAEGETLLVKYDKTAAENISAGFAGYADKEFVLGSGSDNIEYLKSGGSKAVVFTSFPVDMTQYTDRWAELTTKDFKAGITGFKGGVYGVDPREDSASASGLLYDGGFTVTKSASSFTYDSKTGKLSFPDPTYSETNNANAYTVDVTLNLQPTSRFVVWLGTVNGE